MKPDDLEKIAHTYKKKWHNKRDEKPMHHRYRPLSFSHSFVQVDSRRFGLIRLGCTQPNRANRKTIKNMCTCVTIDRSNSRQSNTNTIEQCGTMHKAQCTSNGNGQNIRKLEVRLHCSWEMYAMKVQQIRFNYESHQKIDTTGKLDSNQIDAIECNALNARIF